MSFRMIVPSHWRTELLDDLCDKITDGTHHSPSEADQTPSGDFAYVTAKNIKQGGIDLSRITYLPARIHKPIFERCNPEHGDVLYIKDGATTGVATVNQLDEPFSMLSSVALLKPKREVLNPRFLKWYLNSPTGYTAMTSQMTGTAIKRLTLTKIKEAWAPVAPMPEQVRIVAKIEEFFSDLDAGVAALVRVRANLKRYRAAVLKAAVEGRLTEDWRKLHPAAEPAAKLLERILTERRDKWEQDQLRKFKEAGKTPPKGWKEKYEEPRNPEAEQSVKLPRGWVCASLEQLIQLSEYGTSVKCGYQPGHLPVLRIPNIARGTIDLEDLKFATQDLGLSEGEELIRGDVLMCRTNGSIGLIGKAAVIPEALGMPHYFASYLLRFRFVEVKVVPWWLHLFVTSQPGRQFIESHAASSAGQHNISLSVMHRMSVPVPPLAEQAEIVAEVDRRLSVADAAERFVEHALQRAARLRQAILKRAFDGKLVEQDVTEEPASELVKRLATVQPAKGRVTSRKSKVKA